MARGIRAARREDDGDKGRFAASAKSRRRGVEVEGIAPSRAASSSSGDELAGITIWGLILRASRPGARARDLGDGKRRDGFILVAMKLLRRRWFLFLKNKASLSRFPPIIFRPLLARSHVRSLALSLARSLALSFITRATVAKKED
jgi:hypothetical protein